MTARHSALIITTIALILLALVPTVSAEYYTFDLSEESHYESSGSESGSGSAATYAVDNLLISNSELLYGQDISNVFAQLTATWIPNYNSLPSSGSTTVTIGDWGRATYGYFKYTSDGVRKLQIYLSNFEVPDDYPTGLSGTRKFVLIPDDDDFVFPTATSLYTGYHKDYDLGLAIGTGYSSYPHPKGMHYYSFSSKWENTLTIDTQPGNDIITLNRHGLSSQIDILTSTINCSNTAIEDYQITLFPSIHRPYSVIVTNPISGNTYRYNINSEGILLDDPGDPSRVMVHIIAQDARNENLLLDAAVEVRDQYDAVVAAGTTSPEGWMVFEYDLPDTLTDEDFDRYYTVSVSLPGWTQKVTNFKFYPAFIPRSGDWIRVEMLPDTDGPADPEKTYIMFFVRDIHANPLERASIEIAGQYWHTNSAGHVAVEVPKNSTTAYTVRKTGHVSISGSAAVGAEGSYVVNIALGPALPDRTPGPGDDPGATPPPRDTRTNEEKGKAVIDLIADNAELIATLAILAAVMGLINLIMPGRRRR